MHTFERRLQVRQMGVLTTTKAERGHPGLDLAQCFPPWKTVSGPLLVTQHLESCSVKPKDIYDPGVPGSRHLPFRDALSTV